MQTDEYLLRTVGSPGQRSNKDYALRELCGPTGRTGYKLWDDQLRVYSELCEVEETDLTLEQKEVLQAAKLNLTGNFGPHLDKVFEAWHDAKDTRDLAAKQENP